MDVSKLENIYSHLTGEDFYDKYYHKKDNIKKYLESKDLLYKDYIFLFHRLINKDVWAFIEYISEFIEGNFSDDDSFIELIELVAKKTQGDLAQSVFIRSLINIGKNNPHNGIKLYTKFLSQPYSRELFNYAPIVLGGVGQTNLNEVKTKIAYFTNNFKDDGMVQNFNFWTKALRITLENNDVYNSDPKFYWDYLENLIKYFYMKDRIKMETILLIQQLYDKNPKKCYKYLEGLVNNDLSENMKYFIVDKIWIFGLGKNNKVDEFKIIEKLSKGASKETIRVISNYLQMNYSYDRDYTIKILKLLFNSSGDVGGYLYPSIRKMVADDSVFYLKELYKIAKLGDQKVCFNIYSALHGLDKLEGKDKELFKKLDALVREKLSIGG